MSAPRDPLTSASVTTAWVIVFNKPFYPLYVWWVAGSGVRVSLLTLVALPLFAAVPFLARRSPNAARASLPLDRGRRHGVLDPDVRRKLRRRSLLRALRDACDRLVPGRGGRGLRAPLTALTLLAFAGLRFAAPAGVFPWPPSETAALVNLNLYSAASLTAFIGLRYAAAR